MRHGSEELGMAVIAVSEKLHTCHYCGGATSLGPFRIDAATAKAQPLFADHVYPSCCAAAECIDKWEHVAQAGLSAEVLAQLEPLAEGPCSS